MGTATIFELSALDDILSEAGDYRLTIYADGATDFFDNTMQRDEVRNLAMVGRTNNLNRTDREAVVIGHKSDMVLNCCATEFLFTADRSGGTLSKDGAGRAGSDQRVAYRRISGADRVHVFFVSDGRTTTLTSHPLKNGMNYDLRFEFGAGGIKLFINDQLMGRKPRVATGLSNTQDFVLGANASRSTQWDDGQSEELL